MNTRKLVGTNLTELLQLQNPVHLHRSVNFKELDVWNSERHNSACEQVGISLCINCGIVLLAIEFNTQLKLMTIEI